MLERFQPIHSLSLMLAVLWIATPAYGTTTITFDSGGGETIFVLKDQTPYSESGYVFTTNDLMSIGDFGSGRVASQALSETTPTLIEMQSGSGQAFNLEGFQIVDLFLYDDDKTVFADTSAWVMTSSMSDKFFLDSARVYNFSGDPWEGLTSVSFGLELNGAVDLGDVELAAYMDLDNIRVSAVPIPAALPLFGSAIGLLALAGWRRARRRRV